MNYPSRFPLFGVVKAAPALLFALSLTSVSAAQAAEPASPPGPMEQVLSLDGGWILEPAGGQAREVKVPGFWERIPGFGNVHAATDRREFDIPASFAKQRIFLKFDAVGDAADVSINGQFAGGHVGPALPFAVDITGLVRVPSTSNTLAVLVRDDTHFSIVREGQNRRNRKHWIPRGMGANNRKGLYQSVTLHAVPIVQVADARITTLVRNKELAVQCEIFNGRKETISGQLTAEVVASNGTVVLALPKTSVELPGYVTTTVPLRSTFSGVELWQPDHPTLYQLRIGLTDAKGTPLHRLETRFGFRSGMARDQVNGTEQGHGWVGKCE